MASVCINHTDREADTKCIACFKPICNDCIVAYGGQDYCSELCRDQAWETTANIANMQEKERANAKKKAMKKFIIFIIIAAIVGGAVYYIMNDKESMDKIQEQIDKIPGATD